MKENYNKIVKWLFGLKVKDETLRRKEYLLNVFLLGAIVVASVDNAILLFYYVRLGDDFKGASPIAAVFIMMLLIGLYFLLKKGWVLFVSYILLFLLWLIALGLMIVSGVENQMALLFWAFVITMGSILIDVKNWWKIFLLMFGSIFLVLFAQLKGWIVPYIGWKVQAMDWENGMAYLTVLAIIALSAWLFNKELTKSLKSLKKSQEELKKERDLLEVRVEQRTKELKKAQIEQISQLSKFVEYGRSMSSLLHDLVNPITAISLNLKQVDLMKNKKNRVEEIVGYSNRALRAAEKMELFIVSSKNKLRDKHDVRNFSIKEEITDVVGLFVFKLRREGIELDLKVEDLHLLGDPAKFDQVVSNLMGNAIDAFQKNGQEKKIIEIKVSQFHKNIQLLVKDNGMGIAKDDLNMIFEEFFTTKNDKDGVGIGLTITKHIIEDDFNGTIVVESKINKGTVFYVTIPMGN